MIGWFMVLIILILLRMLADTKQTREFMTAMIVLFCVGSILLSITG